MTGFGRLSETGNQLVHSSTRRFAGHSLRIGSIGSHPLTAFSRGWHRQDMPVYCLGCRREYSRDEYRRHRARTDHADHGEAIR